MAHPTAMRKYIHIKGYLGHNKGKLLEVYFSFTTSKLSMYNIDAHTVLSPMCLSGCVYTVSLFLKVILEISNEELERENKEEEKTSLRVHDQTGHHYRHQFSIAAPQFYQYRTKAATEI